MEIIDNLFAENKRQKVIVFTEFVATQNYLRIYWRVEDIQHLY